MVIPFYDAADIASAVASQIAFTIPGIAEVPLLDGVLSDYLAGQEAAFSGLSNSLKASGEYVAELEKEVDILALASEAAAAANQALQEQYSFLSTFTFDINKSVEYWVGLHKAEFEEQERKWQEALAEFEKRREAQREEDKIETRSWLDRLYDSVFDRLFDWFEDRTEQVVSLAGRILDKVW